MDGLCENMQSYLHIIMDSVNFDEDIIHYHRAAANGGCLTQLTTIIAIIILYVLHITLHPAVMQKLHAKDYQLP